MQTQKPRPLDGKTVIGISGLLAALLHYNAPPAKEHVHLLLRALSIPGDISVNAAHLLLQDNIVNWFQDIKLRPILRDASLWACVARVAFERHDDLFIRKDFIRMGYNLAAMPEWKSDIRKDLASWITVGFVREDNRDPLILQQYISVLSRVWEPNIPDYPFIDAGEKALGVALSTLSKVWADFTRNERVRLSSQKMVALESAVSHRAHKYAALLRSTSWAILREQFTTGRTSQAVRLDLRTFNETFSVPLYESLIRAAREVRNTARNGLGNNIGELAPEQKALPVFDRIATILEDLIGVMPKATETEDEENPDYWRKLRCRFDRDIDALER
ncbi:hypothetical protein B0H13DRAFT_2309222 [Mycena leptocephala]|nr:hypothetical protein B0H13DRAFT_2309222 [Mycena leptocephala]